MRNQLKNLYETVGLKYTIFIMNMILLICMVVSISFISYARIEKSINADIENELIRVSYQFDNNLDYTLALYEKLLHIISVNESIINYLSKTDGGAYDKFDALQQLNKILSIQNFYPNIVKIEIIVDKAQYLIDNNTFIDKKDNLAWYEYMESKSPFYIDWRFVKNKQFVVGGEKSVIQISKKIYDFSREQTLGILSINLNMQPVEELLNGYSVGGNTVILFDNDMNVAYASKDFDNNMINAVKQEPNKDRFNLWNTFVNGDEMEVVYNANNRAGFALVSLTPVKYLRQRLNSLLFFTVLITIAILAIGIAANYMLSNYITEGISKLVEKIKKVSSGNLNVNLDENYYRKDEIGYLDRQFDKMLEKINLLFKEVHEAGMKQKEIELKALEAQINPHFLYNTLSCINWMAIDIDADNISYAINALAKYYRLTLNKGRDIIPIMDEIEQVKAYLDIQKIRFGDKFKATFDIDENLCQYMTPKLILQPFVENAIIHGFEGINYKGLINVTAREEHEHIQFAIVDNGRGMDDDTLNKVMITSNSNSYGIKNVVEKIKLLYGDKYGIEIESKEYNGTKVIISIPKITEEGRL